MSRSRASPIHIDANWRRQIEGELSQARGLFSAQLHQHRSGAFVPMTASSSVHSPGVSPPIHRPLDKSRRPITSSSSISFAANGASRRHRPFSDESPVEDSRPSSAFGLYTRQIPNNPLNTPLSGCVESLWPGPRWGLGFPLRPSLRVTSEELQNEGFRWMGGVWRPRPQTSPRAYPTS